MEAIAAFGLACNVLQVTETSLKLANLFREAYKHNTIKEDEDALRLSNNLSSAVGELQSSMQQPLSKDDTELNDIALQCLSKATKLHDKIAPNLTSTSTRRRDRLRRGFKAVQLSFNNEIKDLEIEIQTLRKDLDTRVLISLRSRYDLASTQQVAAFSSLRSDVKDFIHQQIELQNQQHRRTRQTVQEETAKISIQMQSMHVSADQQKVRDKLLNSLFFPDMNARKNQISAAHPDTFKWLFKQDLTDLDTDTSGDVSNDKIKVTDPHDSDPKEMSKLRNSFHDWLKNGQRVYWISGKPGSGKSTLMNFIAEHKLTREYLKEWNKSQDLVLVESYLWNAGAEDQRTFRGVLATLLTQVLKRSPLFLDSVLYKDSNLSQKSTLMDWSIQELEKWLLHCLNSNDFCCCVFIDGLDEAEVVTTGPGNPILHFIEKVAALTNVKCCVSSRPLRQFEVAFHDYPCLRLQDLNAGDIRKYFEDNAKPILKNSGIDVLSGEFESLQRDFCSKADGVFLWACLAVGSLKRGVDNCDDLSKLRERLKDLPPELEDLYRHMWKQQNKDVRLYQAEASLFLNVHLKIIDNNGATLWSRIALSPLHFVFIRPNNYHISCAALAGRISEDLEQACKHIQAQITSRCAGLLEVVAATFDRRNKVEMSALNNFPALQAACHNEVRFVHRTARDFLLTSTFGRGICSSSKHTDLELRRLICRARLCKLMVTSATPKPSHLNELMVEMTWSSSPDEDDNIVLVNDVEKAFKDRVLSSQEHLDESNWFTLHAQQRRPWDEHTLACDFLGSTLLAGIPWLVMDKLNRCIQGCSPGYRLHLLFHWLLGLQAVCQDFIFYERTISNTFLDLLWTHMYCSKELFRHVAYLKFFSSPSPKGNDLSVRMCAAEILLQTLQTLLALRSKEMVVPLSFFENLLNLPFPRDQQIFLFGGIDRTRKVWYLTAPTYEILGGFNGSIRARSHQWFHLQCRMSFLLRAAIRCVETRYAASLSHLSKDLPVAPLHPEFKVLAITDRATPDRPTVKVERADSAAIVTLLGYDGPSGHEKFSDDLWGPKENKEAMDELCHKIDSVLENGEKIGMLTCWKEFGLVKDIDDPEAGEWPPPLFEDKKSQASSGRQHDETSTDSEDEHDTSTLQDHDRRSPMNSGDSSDEDQFVDALEQFS